MAKRATRAVAAPASAITRHPSCRTCWRRPIKITAPRMPLSRTSRFAPPPRMKKGMFSSRITAQTRRSSSLLEGTRKQSAGPPMPNVVCRAMGSCRRICSFFNMSLNLSKFINSSLSALTIITTIIWFSLSPVNGTAVREKRAENFRSSSFYFYFSLLFFFAMISLMIRCATSETEMPRFMLVTCIRRCASSSEMP